MLGPMFGFGALNELCPLGAATEFQADVQI
jgi:hypothetical protein